MCGIAPEEDVCSDSSRNFSSSALTNEEVLKSIPLEKPNDGPEEVALHLISNHAYEFGFRKVMKVRLDGPNRPVPVQVLSVSGAPGACGALKGLKVPNKLMRVDEVSFKYSLDIANFRVEAFYLWAQQRVAVIKPLSKVVELSVPLPKV